MLESVPRTNQCYAERLYSCSKETNLDPDRTSDWKQIWTLTGLQTGNKFGPWQQTGNKFGPWQDFRLETNLDPDRTSDWKQIWTLTGLQTHVLMTLNSWVGHYSGNHLHDQLFGNWGVFFVHVILDYWTTLISQIGLLIYMQNIRGHEFRGSLYNKICSRALHFGDYKIIYT